MIQRLTIIFALMLGIPALAQSGMPMSGPAACERLHAMMPNPKSAADRAYMAAMMQMHQGMIRGTMTGNADRDFLMMMIPHHEAAVAMAQTELQYGKDPKVKALAKAIIAAQNREINEMKAWLK